MRCVCRKPQGGRREIQGYLLPWLYPFMGHFLPYGCITLKERVAARVHFLQLLRDSSQYFLAFWFFCLRGGMSRSFVDFCKPCLNLVNNTDMKLSSQSSLLSGPFVICQDPGMGVTCQDMLLFSLQGFVDL